MAPQTRGKKVAPPKKANSKKTTSSKKASSSKQASSSKKAPTSKRASMPKKDIPTKPHTFRRPISKTPPPPTLRIKDAIWSEEEKEERKLFEKVEIIPTRYMRKETLQKLGLYEEVCYLLECMGLHCLIDMKEPLYKKEVRDFVSTMKIVFNAPSNPKPRYGYISFKIGDKEYLMSLLGVCMAYGLPFGEEAKFPYWDGINSFWDLIADGPYTNTNPYASKIRNPVIRYVQRLLAETFFARFETSKALKNEVFLIYRGLVDDLMEWKEYADSDDVGSKMNVGLLFLKFIKGFQGNWVKNTNIPSIYFGSMLTPLFKKANVPLGEVTLDENRLGIHDLIHSGFLRVNKTTLETEYIFNGFGSGERMTLALPCDKKTNIGSLENVIFTHLGKEIEKENPKESTSTNTRGETSREGGALTIPSTSSVTLPFVPQTMREEQLLKAMQEERRAFEEKVQQQFEELKRQVFGMQSQTHQEERLSIPTEGSVTRAETTQAAEALAAMKEATEIPPPMIQYKRKRKRETNKESSP